MATIEHYDRVIAVGVDMQNDFCPGGALAVPEGDRVIPVFNRVADWVRNHNGIVALTADWHPEETSHFDMWPPHCVGGTQGAEFHPDLNVTPGDYSLRKGMKKNEDAYSGFDAVLSNGRKLEQIIHPAKEVVALVIGGLATDYCVKATTLDAIKKTRKMQFVDVYVLEDGIAAVDLLPGDGAKAIREMKMAGAKFITSEDILQNRNLEA